MRRKRLALFCSTLMVFACTRQLPEDMGGVDDRGKLSVVLYTEGDMIKSKSTTVSAEFVPELEDLKVEVFKNPGPDQVRLYRDSYKNTLSLEGGCIPLNCADYRILASYGDSLGTGFTADKIYYAGRYDFTLEPNEEELAEVLVKPSNIRVSVEYGENLNYDYSDFYVKVCSQTRAGKKKSLRFDYDETRAGYVPYGSLRVELYVNINGQDLYYPSPEIEVNPGDDITFKVETERVESELNLQLTVVAPDEQEKNILVPSVTLPKDAPGLSQTGLDRGSFIMEPGDAPYDDLRLDIKADGAIENCWLNINSDYLAGLGVPEKVDLASETLGLDDPDQAGHIAEILKGVGLDWMGYMNGNRLAYVDFSGVTEFISTTPCTPQFDADFSVEVVDARDQNSQHVGTISTDTYSFGQVIPAPTVVVEGFGSYSDGRIVVLEGTGVSASGLKTRLTAKGGIASCWLNIDSKYLADAGMTSSRIDLANIDEESEEAKILRNIGLDWTRDMASDLTGEVDFSGIVEYMDTHHCDGSTSDFAKFSIELENAHYGSANEKMAASSVGEFDYLVPVLSVNRQVVEGNVWAKKILDFSADCTIDQAAGIALPAQQLKLQYSTDGQWKDIASAKFSYPTISCAKLQTEPSTKYQFRAIYHDNPNLKVEFNSYTTEQILQIDGGDFDEWEDMVHTYYAEKVYGMGDTYLSRYYYLPTPTSWWAVNSMKTMPAKTSPNFTIKLGSITYETGETQTYKVFPTITKYVGDADGDGNAAQIATIHVCNMATEGNAGDGGLGTLGAWFSPLDKEVYLSAGELCIGKSDASGNLSYDGHAFASRPSKISFKYQYDSRSNESSYFKFELRSGSKVIASHEVTGGGASEWTTYTFDVPYSDSQSKATSIFMTFKSTNDSPPYYKDNGSIELMVNGAATKVHCGSVLRIDDIQLIYE